MVERLIGREGRSGSEASRLFDEYYELMKRHREKM